METKLNNFARLCLMKKWLLPLEIIIVFNLGLSLELSSIEDDMRLYMLIISLCLLALVIAGVIFYPRFMNLKFYLVLYIEHLDKTISNYNTQINKVTKKIKIIEASANSNFIINEEHRFNESLDMDDKLLREVLMRKQEILDEYRKDLKKLIFAAQKSRGIKEECSRLLKVKSYGNYVQAN